jgi:putative oxidoreductase
MAELFDRAGNLYRRSQEAKESGVVRDASLLVARIGLAWIFIYHGSYTLFGAFGGPGIHRASIFYGTVAHLHPATFFTVLGGIIECFGGAAVGLGIFGRIAAASIAGDMAMAMITVTWANGIASNKAGGGYELNLALCVLAVVVALLGTGRFSLDQAIRTFWEKRPSRSNRNANSDHSVAHGSENGYHDHPGRIAAS